MYFPAEGGEVEKVRNFWKILVSILNDRASLNDPKIVVRLYSILPIQLEPAAAASATGQG